MNQKEKKVKAVDVGSFISEDYANELQQSFKETYPEMDTRFTFSKELMLKVLNSSTAITGIRFIYGLTDKLNPNSIRLILVPCTTASEFTEKSKPLIFSHGYYDHKGQLNSIKQTAELIAKFVAFIKSKNKNLEYKTITRGTYAGRNSLMALTRNTTCKNIALNFGQIESIIQPVLQPLDKDLIAEDGIYLDFLRPCPPFGNCDEGTGELMNGACFATIALNHLNRSEREKLFFLRLRDQLLFQIDNGHVYYEMFHFISPIVSLLIPKLINSDEVLTTMYNDRLSPLKKLIEQEKYEEAAKWIVNGFDELIEEFETDKVENLLQKVE